MAIIRFCLFNTSKKFLAATSTLAYFNAAISMAKVQKVAGGDKHTMSQHLYY